MLKDLTSRSSKTEPLQKVPAERRQGFPYGQRRLQFLACRIDFRQPAGMPGDHKILVGRGVVLAAPGVFAVQISRFKVGRRRAAVRTS
jgi:hypothetical protein